MSGPESEGQEGVLLDASTCQLFALPLPTPQESEEACGETGRDKASHCCPKRASEDDSCQPGKIKTAVTMTTNQQPQDRYWETWAGDPGQWKWVSRGLDAMCLGVWSCHC